MTTRASARRLLAAFLIALLLTLLTARAQAQAFEFTASSVSAVVALDTLSHSAVTRRTVCSPSLVREHAHGDAHCLAFNGHALEAALIVEVAMHELGATVLSEWQRGDINEAYVFGAVFLVAGEPVAVLSLGSPQHPTSFLVFQPAY